MLKNIIRNGRWWVKIYFNELDSLINEIIHILFPRIQIAKNFIRIGINGEKNSFDGICNTVYR